MKRTTQTMKGRTCFTLTFFFFSFFSTFFDAMSAAPPPPPTLEGVVEVPGLSHPFAILAEESSVLVASPEGVRRVGLGSIEENSNNLKIVTSSDPLNLIPTPSGETIATSLCSAPVTDVLLWVSLYSDGITVVTLNSSTLAVGAGDMYAGGGVNTMQVVSSRNHAWVLLGGVLLKVSFTSGVRIEAVGTIGVVPPITSVAAEGDAVYLSGAKGVARAQISGLSGVSPRPVPGMAFSYVSVGITQRLLVNGGVVFAVLPGVGVFRLRAVSTSPGSLGVFQMCCLRASSISNIVVTESAVLTLRYTPDGAVYYNALSEQGGGVKWFDIALKGAEQQPLFAADPSAQRIYFAQDTTTSAGSAVKIFVYSGLDAKDEDNTTTTTTTTKAVAALNVTLAPDTEEECTDLTLWSAVAGQVVVLLSVADLDTPLALAGVALMLVGRECSGDAALPWVLNPTWWLHGDADSVSPLGVVMGNLAVIVALMLFFLSISAVLRVWWARCPTLGESPDPEGHVLFPSLPLYLVQILLHGVVYGAVLLVTETEAYNVVIGVVVLLLCAVCPVLLVVKVIRDIPWRACYVNDPWSLEQCVSLEALQGEGEWVNVCPNDEWVMRFGSLVRRLNEGNVGFVGVQLGAGFALAVSGAVRAAGVEGAHTKIAESVVLAVLCATEVCRQPYAARLDNACHPATHALLSVAALTLAVTAYTQEGQSHSTFTHYLPYAEMGAALLVITVQAAAKFASLYLVHYSRRRERVQSWHFTAAAAEGSSLGMFHNTHTKGGEHPDPDPEPEQVSMAESQIQEPLLLVACDMLLGGPARNPQTSLPPEEEVSQRDLSGKLSGFEHPLLHTPCLTATMVHSIATLSSDEETPPVSPMGSCRVVSAPQTRVSSARESPAKVLGMSPRHARGVGVLMSAALQVPSGTMRHVTSVTSLPDSELLLVSPDADLCARSLCDSPSSRKYSL